MEGDNDDSLVECDIENVVENLNILENEKNGGDDTSVSEVGMTFNDETEMLEFYKRYAFVVGFPMRKRNSKKGEDGVMRYVTFTYSREGRRSYATSRSLKPQATSQTDYKARISAFLDTLEIWRINKVYIDHSHKTSPSKFRLHRCNQNLSASVKRKLVVNDVAGISLHKSYNSAVVEADGYENTTFVENDCRNYVEQVQRLRLEEGDASAIHAYFLMMQARCSGFYFSMDLDDECRLKNVFWADNSYRQSYKEFGAVVIFDTTYLTNKYDMPFAPFFGINCHGQSTLLDCGLISNEDIATFVWLFRTWFECMHGQAPNRIKRWLKAEYYRRGIKRCPVISTTTMLVADTITKFCSTGAYK